MWPQGTTRTTRSSRTHRGSFQEPLRVQRHQVQVRSCSFQHNVEERAERVFIEIPRQQQSEWLAPLPLSHPPPPRPTTTPHPGSPPAAWGKPPDPLAKDTASQPVSWPCVPPCTGPCQSSPASLAGHASSHWSSARNELQSLSQNLVVHESGSMSRTCGQ